MKKLMFTFFLQTISIFMVAITINIPNDYETIQLGIDVATSGDTVLVADGSYNENLDIDFKSIFLSSLNGAQYTEITGDNDCVISNSRYTSINGFTLTTQDEFALEFEFPSSSYANGICTINDVFTNASILVKNASLSISDSIIEGYIEFEMVRFNYNYAPFEYYYNFSNLITNSIIAYTSSEGYDNYIHKAYFDIDNCSINNMNLSYSAQNQNQAYHITNLSNSTIGSLGGFGGNEGLQQLICNNTVFTGGSMGVANIEAINCDFINYSITGGGEILNSIFWPDEYNNPNIDFSYSINVLQYGNGNLLGNPMFEDEAHGNYNLLLNSPCIDAGDPLSELDPDGTRKDIGAIFYNQTGNFEPQILSVLDVPDDQGGAVRIQWNRSINDIENGNISFYGIWRILEDESMDGIAQIPAIQSTSYQFVANTVNDSIPTGTFWESYVISAHTTNPSIYYFSEPDSGYSVDNIAPYSPENSESLINVDNVCLSWDISSANDFYSTKILRDGIEIGVVGGTEFIDENIESDTEYSYEIIHTDHHFNDSEPSTINVRTISWNIECVASLNGNSSSLVLGTAEDGTDGFDVEYDQPSPPNPPSNFVSIYTYHIEWENPLGNNFNQDILNEIPLDDTMQIWEINLISDNGGSTDVVFNFSDNIPVVPVFIYQETDTRRNNREIIYKEQITNGESYTFDLEPNTNQIFYLAIGDITPPELAVTYPNGLEILQSGEEATFGWEATDGFMIDNNVVSISYDGENFDEIGTISENSILFTPENPLSNSCIIKVVSTDFAENSSEDISDYEFTVVGSEFSSELAAGWNLWSSPLELETIFAEQIEDDFEEEYFAYNWLDGSYSEVENINVGKSIWLGFMEEAEFTIEGNPFTNAIEVSYNSGWNMIANPLVRNIDKSMLIIIVDEQEYSFEEAITNGFVEENIYKFYENNYQTIDELEYINGYWLGVYEDEIIVRYQPHQTIETVRDLRERDYYWQVEINNLNIAGMENTEMVWDVNDIPLPPADPSGFIADSYISHPEWENPLGNNFSSDIRPVGDLEDTQTYNLVFAETQTLSYTITDIDDDIEVFLTIDETVYNLAEDDVIEVEPCNATLQIGRNIVGVDDNAIPRSTKLIGNYPNPFNPTTKIDFSLNQDSNVELGIYNIKGQLIKQLGNDYFEAGYHNLTWNGDDNNGNKVSSGVYFYRFSAENYSKTNKMILLK
jgi:hypothetical protein